MYFLLALRDIWARLIQFGFRLLYNPLAWAYDAVSAVVSQGEWRSWTQAAIPHVRGPRVLELGFGPGHLLGDLAAAGYQVTGMDLSPAMVRLARRNLRRRHCSARLIRGRAPALPFADGVFDSVVLTFPSPYAVQSETLTELGRVLSPAGRFVLVEGGRLTGRDPWSWLLNLAFAVTSRSLDVAQVQSLADEAAARSRLDRQFQVDANRIHLRRSTVWVFVARKRKTNVV